MKYIPSEKQIEELLENSSLKPSKQLDQRLSTAPWTPRAVARRRSFNTAIFALMTFALLTATTPQGRAFAQKLLGFFATTSQSSFPATPQVTQAASPIAMIPIITAPTAIPSNLEECNIASATSSVYICQLSAAEKALGFEIKTFSRSGVEAVFGKDLTFNSVAIDTSTRSAQLIFDHLWLREGLGNFPPAKSPWDIVPQTEIEATFVWEYPAEYLKGDFIQMAGSQEFIWESEVSTQRLRWKEGDRWFEIRNMGGSREFSPQIDKFDLIALAETLVSSSQGTDLLAGKSSPDLDQRAGFHVKFPSILPEGFHLCFADYGAGYDGPTAFLSYCDNEGVTLVIDQMLLTNASPYDFTERFGKEITVTSIQIGSIPGHHALRADGVQVVVWEADGIRTQIVFQPVPYMDSGKRVEKTDLLVIAESMQ